MAGIVYDARRIKAYNFLEKLCEYAGETVEFGDTLWQELLHDTELFEEFIFYAENHTIQGTMNVAGYSLLDLFILEMDHYNLTHDTGKNTAFCNKEKMVLRAFYTMSNMKKDPETYIKKFESGSGMDQI